MRYKISLLTKGAAISTLKRNCGREMVSCLMRRGLLEQTNKIADTVWVDGYPMDVNNDPHTGDYFAIGDRGGVWEHVALTPEDVYIHRIKLREFLIEVLQLDVFNAAPKQLRPIREGSAAYKLPLIRSYNVNPYLTLNNSEVEYFLIEKECKTFSKSVVIISPEDEVPSSYRGIVGNCQRIFLDAVADFSEPDPVYAPLSFFLAAVGHTDEHPMKVMPNLSPDECEWKDIVLDLRDGDMIDIYIKNKKKVFRMDDLYFCRKAANAEHEYITQTRLLLILAKLGEWQSMGGTKLQKTLERLNTELQVFFCQKNRFYEKGKDGMFRPCLEIRLSDNLSKEVGEFILKVRNEPTGTAFRDAKFPCGITDWDALRTITNKYSKD